MNPARRWTLGLLWTTALLGGSVAAAYSISGLVERAGIRLDVTSGARHELSDRAAGVLARLNGPWELIVAVDASTLPPAAIVDLTDTLAAFDAAGPTLAAGLIDVGTAQGRAQYETLLERLTARDRAALDQAESTLRGVAAALDDAANSARDRFDPGLAAVRELIPSDAPAAEANRAFFEQRAAASRLLAGELAGVARDLRGALDAGRSNLPGVVAEATELIPVDVLAAQTRQPLEAAAVQFGSLAEQLDRFISAPGLAPAAQDASLPLRDAARAIRDGLSRAQQAAAEIQTPPVLRVRRALESGQGALVVGPGSAAAIDLRELLLDPEAAAAIGLARSDLRRRSEEMLATALASASGPAGPIVVFTHAEPQPFLDRSTLFSAALNRLRSRGFEVIEWASAVSADPPPLGRLDPDGLRPVVVLSLSPDSAAGTSAVGQGLTGPQRAQRLGEAVQRAIDQGWPVLLSLNPSVLPSFGEPDPIAAVAARLGIEAATDRPLLTDPDGDSGPQRAGTTQVVIPPPAEHPIAAAIAGLRTRLEWSTPLRIDPDDTAGSSVLASVSDDGSTWAEADWVGYWRTPRESRPSLAQQPGFDPARDGMEEDWPVIAAAERPSRARGSAGNRERFAAARLVVVGSNSWFADPVAAEAALVDGRAVAVNPGNLELLEASLWWLAGRDEMIATSATAGTVPTVRALAPSALRAIKFGVVLGPLVGLVVAWGAWRVLARLVSS